MGPAADIIEICGGAAAVAAWLGLDPSTVHRWTYEKGDRGGTDGLIPHKYHEPILLRAHAEKKPLRPAHFFPRYAAAIAAHRRKAAA